MNPLANPAIIRHIMQKHNISFNKKYGQNFLTDENILDNIISRSGITDKDYILEIGPGIGTLTWHLASAAKKIVSVEIDSGLINVLADTLSDFDNVKIIHSDILKVNLEELINTEFNSENPCVIANLPYYITSPIIMNLLESKIKFKKIVVMVQKEVAQRISSSPGTKDYGIITIAVNYYADTKILFDVPRNCFMPAPNVDSAILEMTPRTHPTCKPKNEEIFFKTVKASFAQRRKTLLNSLCNSGYFHYSKSDIESAIYKAGIDPSVRGETLSLEKFAILSDELCNLS